MARFFSAEFKDLDLRPNHLLHDLRHTFITRYQECGIKRGIVSLLAGHTADSSITSIVYTHLEQYYGKQPEENSELYAKLHIFELFYINRRIKIIFIAPKKARSRQFVNISLSLGVSFCVYYRKSRKLNGTSLYLCKFFAFDICRTSFLYFSFASPYLLYASTK